MRVKQQNPTLVALKLHGGVVAKESPDEAEEDEDEEDEDEDYDFDEEVAFKEVVLEKKDEEQPPGERLDQSRINEAPPASLPQQLFQLRPTPALQLRPTPALQLPPAPALQLPPAPALQLPPAPALLAPASAYLGDPRLDDLQYPCHVCGRAFRFEKNRLRHLHKTHQALPGGDQVESVLKCKLCPYTTRHYSNMYVHIRTHTGDKPYWCGACGAAFTQGSSLKLHIRSRHHDNMGFFSLNKKLGKNNLTKLWQRVLKTDLAEMSSFDRHRQYQQRPLIPELGGVAPHLFAANQQQQQQHLQRVRQDRGTMTEPSLSDHQPPPPHHLLAVENARLRLELQAVKQNAARLLGAAFPNLPMDPEAVARFLALPPPLPAPQQQQPQQHLSYHHELLVFPKN